MLLTDEKIDRTLEQGYWTNQVITDQLDAVAAADPGQDRRDRPPWPRSATAS